MAPEPSQPQVKITNLLELLALHGGKIVSTASLEPLWIDQARAGGRMYVDENSLGYVWEPESKIPTTTEEVALFEKWFPLDIPMPDDLKTTEWLEKLLEERRNIQ